MKRFLLSLLMVLGFWSAPTAVFAQSDEWFVGSHPDYHAAMIRDIDGIFVAIFVSKEPSIYASPVIMETLAPACDTKRPIEMHATEAIMAYGATPADRLKEIRRTVQSFFDRAVKSCPAADDLEARFFHRFDDAYLATDSLLVEAGIFPLSQDEPIKSDDPVTERGAEISQAELDEIAKKCGAPLGIVTLLENGAVSFEHKDGDLTDGAELEASACVLKAIKEAGVTNFGFVGNEVFEEKEEQ